MMVVCIMIGLANGVILLMRQGMIIDTAVHAMATMLEMCIRDSLCGQCYLAMHGD